MSFILKLFLIVPLGIFLILTAEVAAQDISCPPPKSYQDIVRCALQQHPKIQQEQWKFRAIPAQKLNAGQRPNPEFNLDFALSPKEIDTRAEAEIFLSYPFELGKKRKARLQKVDSHVEIVKAQLRQKQEEILIQTLLKLHRLRQIKIELLKLTEALRTFYNIQKHYHNRLQLSPEQEVSLDIFIFASQDYELKKTKLKQEQRKILDELAIITGMSHSQILSNLPKTPRHWPKINQKDKLNSSNNQLAQAQINKAYAEMKAAKALSWPDLKIGPLIQYERTNQNEWRYGLGLSMPLPIINQNQGSKALAKTNLNAAKDLKKIEKNNTLKNHQQLRKQYQYLAQHLKKSESFDRIQKSHHKLHQLFKRGMIAPQLVIEAHRQIVDLTNDRHKLEQETLFLLWSIYVQEDRALQEIGL